MSNGQNIASQVDIRPCPRCGSTEIKPGIEINQGIEVGPFGLAFTGFARLRGTERLRADLCLNCGTVTRLFVRNIQKKWACS
ncbi:MAG: hypothetical protein P4L03_03585 [Terracidiphilus sp.]|nr:hypothetical protein [Terracidiphilus sp.]